MLLAFAIVLGLLVGGNLSFFGAVTTNIVTWVKDLGANGLVGLMPSGSSSGYLESAAQLTDWDR